MTNEEFVAWANENRPVFEKIFGEGFLAYINGLSYENCPYIALEWNVWQKGFETGKLVEMFKIHLVPAEEIYKKLGLSDADIEKMSEQIREERKSKSTKK